MTHNLQVLIVEDDISFALELELLVQDIGYEVIATVDNSADALDTIFSATPDFILMDIDIKGKLSGIEVAEKIAHLKIPILYITSFEQEDIYQKAQKTYSIGYLVKPLSLRTLRTTIEMALRSIGGKKKEEDQDFFILEQTYFAKKNNRLYKILQQNILFIQSDGPYAVIHTNIQRFVLNTSLTKIQSILPQKDFMRIHKSYIIQLNHIENISLTENELILAGHSIPLGRTYKKDLLRHLKTLH